VVHPALHNKNLSPVILGPAIELSGRHAKIRREGYRRLKTLNGGGASDAAMGSRFELDGVLPPFNA
jgi:hypothetical protein